MTFRERIRELKRRLQDSLPLISLVACTVSGVLILFLTAYPRVRAVAVLIFCASTYSFIYGNREDRR